MSVWDTVYNGENRTVLLGDNTDRKQVLLRRAIGDDVPQVVAIRMASDRFHMSPHTSGPSDEELHHWVLDDRALFVVAEMERTVVGYAYGVRLSPAWFLFDEMAVAPRAQGKGVGKALYAFLRDCCKRGGVELIQGVVESGNGNALAYWTKRGFEPGAVCTWVEDWLDDE